MKKTGALLSKRAIGIALAGGTVISIFPLNPPGGCSANDCGTCDLDGDGQFDIVLKVY